MQDKNTGVLVPPQLDPLAWIAGAESGVVYKTLVQDGDWTPFLPTYEDQERHPGFDSASCVTFSGLNCLEAQLDRMISLGSLPAGHFDFLKTNGYLDANGKVNFSDRFSAILDGTTPNGNYMSNAPDSFARDGLIPESVLPFPEDVLGYIKRNPDGSLMQDGKAQKYYLDPNVITQDMKDLGKRFAKYFDIRYEVITYGATGTPNIDLIRYHLKQAPLHFAAAICSGENTEDVILSCGVGAGHARMIYKANQTDGYIGIFDSFFKGIKKIALDFPIPYIYKIVITTKNAPTAPAVFSHTFKVRLVPEDLRRANPGVYPENDPNEVIALQRTLQLLGNLDPRIVPVANFGPLTKAAVIDFQTKNQVATPGEIKIAAGTVGPKTRDALNSALLALLK